MCAPLIPKFVVRTSEPAQCAVVRSAIDVTCFHFFQNFEHLRRFSMPVFSTVEALRATPQLSKYKNPFKEVFGRRLFCEIASIAQKIALLLAARFRLPRSLAQRRQAAETQSRMRGRWGEEEEILGMPTKETGETGRRRLGGRRLEGPMISCERDAIGRV